MVFITVLSDYVGANKYQIPTALTVKYRTILINWFKEVPHLHSRGYGGQRCAARVGLGSASFSLLCSFLFTFNVSVVKWLYMQWLFKVGAKSLQYSIKNRYIQRTMCIWLFFERSILAHLKNSLNDTDSNTQKVWWIIWETSGLPTRDTIYMFNMMIENKIYSITLTCKTK